MRFFGLVFEAEASPHNHCSSCVSLLGAGIRGVCDEIESALCGQADLRVQMTILCTTVRGTLGCGWLVDWFQDRLNVWSRQA